MTQTPHANHPLLMIAAGLKYSELYRNWLMLTVYTRTAYGPLTFLQRHPDDEAWMNPKAIVWYCLDHVGATPHFDCCLFLTSFYHGLASNQLFLAGSQARHLLLYAEWYATDQVKPWYSWTTKEADDRIMTWLWKTAMRSLELDSTEPLDLKSLR